MHSKGKCYTDDKIFGVEVLQQKSPTTGMEKKKCLSAQKIQHGV